MKKLLSYVFIVLAVATVAQADPLSDARRREREARNGYPGYLVPGHGPHRPPLSPMPPPPPRYDDLYGPAYTVRWQDMGTSRTEKIIDTDIHLNAQGQFVNELLLTAQENMVQIKSAQARLVNGQVVNLPQLAVTLGKNQQLAIRLDSYYSLRVDQIVLNVISPNLFGSRGKLQVHLGLAY